MIKVALFVFGIYACKRRLITSSKSHHHATESFPIELRKQRAVFDQEFISRSCGALAQVLLCKSSISLRAVSICVKCLLQALLAPPMPSEARDMMAFN
ncbi:MULTISPECIES: hypothetical protein [Pseudomonas]|jgi:hypothetical protein|uniref:hypothetical protein n=1 Tax=Pseudomonas TaxID=286 RepID=UPI0015C2D9DB|nr:MULTISPECIES: hypothetical protein [Pseudomonas]